MKTLKLDSPLTEVHGIGTKYAAKFQKAGFVTLFDLLFHFPIHYIDFANAVDVVQPGVKQLYRVKVLKWSLSNLYKRRLSILRLKAFVGELPVTIVFFNQAYLTQFLKTHPVIYIYGQFEMEKGIYQANTPTIFDENRPNHAKTEPVYSKINTIKSGNFRQIMHSVFPMLIDPWENLPGFILQKYQFPPIVSALAAIHFPPRFEPEEIEAQKRRFIYSEFLFFQLELQYIRQFFKQVPRVFRYPVLPQWRESLATILPFALTPDQENACQNIMSDLMGDFTMQRLLQGDVGSGKTIVAFVALWMATAGGFQGAFLAPTEILAAQQFHAAERFFTQANIALLTGSTSSRERKTILRRLSNGEIDIVFGTHALLTEAVQFKCLTMVVIDEQHRFGVSQRAALYYKGRAVDLLVTTATPIPRTMLLSLYNDLGVSTIKTKPQGRLPVITKIRRPDQRDEFYQRLKEKVVLGQKVFIILPLIEKSEFFNELRDIESESEYFQSIFKGLPIGIVTGRTPAAEKDALLESMMQGTINVLIATTVIEVGIDVKDATIMVIENADRYGLSQLHQLRGRVGRGSLQSYCYLFPSATLTESGKQRLKTIVETNDGFEIAETDLKMRGGGIIAGLQQSGHLDFKIANMQDHHHIFKEARQDAALILADKTLANPYIDTFLDTIKQKLKDINFS